jgi:hypothetical protein
MPRRSDRPSIMMRVVAGPRLEPVTAHDAEILSSYKFGTELTVEPKHTKNNRFLAKYWSILSRVVENTDWVSTKALHSALMLEMRLFNKIRLFNGEMLAEPMSLSELDQEDFELYYHQVLDFICEHVIPGMDRAALEARPS